MYQLPRLFHVGVEGNLPTLFSVFILILAATLLWAISVGTRREGGGHVLAWRGLAVGFLFMGVDEGAGIHDQVVARLLRHVDGGAWYVAAVPFVLVLGALYLPFATSLWRTHGWRYVVLFWTSAVLYLGGALGVESVEDGMRGAGASEAALRISMTFEEGMEMFGVVLFIYALLRYIGEQGYSLRLYSPGDGN